MSKAIRTGAAALAFAAMVAQPIAAFAEYDPPPANPGYAYGVAWALPFFLCAGMTVGQQDEWAKKHHTVVTGEERLQGFLRCVIPPLGFYELSHH
jgi:hypothetical protein